MPKTTLNYLNVYVNATSGETIVFTPTKNAGAQIIQATAVLNALSGPVGVKFVLEKAATNFVIGNITLNPPATSNSRPDLIGEFSNARTFNVEKDVKFKLEFDRAGVAGDDITFLFTTLEPGDV